MSKWTIISRNQVAFHGVSWSVLHSARYAWWNSAERYIVRTNSLCSRSVHKGKTWQNNSPWFLSSSRPKSELPSCQSEDYLKALGVTYHFLSKPLIEMAKCHLDPKKPSICHSASAAKLCSWSDMNCNWLGVRWRVCSCLFPTSIWGCTRYVQHMFSAFIGVLHLRFVLCKDEARNVATWPRNFIGRSVQNAKMPRVQIKLRATST